jgi:hypothetical protein
LSSVICWNCSEQLSINPFLVLKEMVLSQD